MAEECRHGLEHGCTICKHGVAPRRPDREVSRPFDAKFPGECPACEGDIYVGHRICKVTEGDRDRYVHAGCV